MRMNTDGLTAASEGLNEQQPAHRSVGLLFRVVFALALLVPAAVIGASPVAAMHSIGASTSCNNGVGGGGGQGVICEVTIANTITATGGSAVVTVHECIGSYGVPEGSCSTTTTTLTLPVTVVNQCNGTVEGGGSKLLCSIVITNTFVGVTPGASGVTINQCVGSGDGTTVGCTPLEATTSAVITQCNGTANGGTLVGLTCTATGEMSSAFAMTINQCNDSANGGGSLVICSTGMTNLIGAATTPAPASGSPAPVSGSPAPSTTRATTPAPSSTASDTPGSNPTPFLPLMILLAVGGLVLATVVTQRRSLRN